jgi:hypothetical protein
MNNKIKSIILVMLMLLAGCNAAINFQGKVAGISSGKFFYQDGSLITEYKADIDPVWRACEKALTELKAIDVQKDRKISTGVIKAFILEENVTIKVEYLDRNLTSVSVFAGTVGNHMASRLIHDKIAGHLAIH